MKKIKKIMVACDFSEYSAQALEYAVELADNLKADLIVTNLYDLIEAVSEEVKSGEDHLVSIIVKDMLYTNGMVARLQ